MPVIFVHGNPETAAVWDPLLAELASARSVPSRAGLPLAARIRGAAARGFGATLGEYRDWLIGELTAFGEPVDLVGHDVGGGHVLNVVLNRPDLVRSWASDVLGIYDPEYQWHELARRWQTPGIGEADVAVRFGGTIEDRAAALVERGMGRQSPPASPRAGRGDGPRRARALPGPPPSRAWSARLGAGACGRAARDWRSWPPPTTPSGLRSNGAAPLAGPGPGWSSSAGSATGG